MADLRDQKSLDDLVTLCRPLSENGLQAVMDYACSLYMDEQGFTPEDLARLGQKMKRERISPAFDAATLAPRDPGFDAFLARALEPVRKRKGPRHG